MAGSVVANANLHYELRSTLAQYQSLIERLPAITYVDYLGPGASEFVSPQVEELFGMTQEEWLGSADAWLNAVIPAIANAPARDMPLSQEHRSRSATSIASCRPTGSCAGWSTNR